MSSPTTSAGLLSILNEQVQDVHNWRNIQEIVRSTFKLMNDILQQQAIAINRLEQEKVSLTEYVNGMKTKADAADVSAKFDSVGNSLNEKASTEDVAHHLNQKADKTTIQQITKEMNDSLREVSEALNPKNFVDDLRAQIETKTDRKDTQTIAQKIDLIKGELMAKANAVDVAREMESKASVTEVNAALDTKCDKTAYDELLAQKANRTSVINALKQKANVASVDEALNQRPTFEQIDGMLRKKADVTQFQQISQSKPDKTQIDTLIGNAIDEMQQRLESELKLVGDDIRKVSQKAENDVQTANSKQGNDLRELKAALATKVDRGELQTFRDAVSQAQRTTALTMGQQFDTTIAEMHKLIQDTKDDVSTSMTTCVSRADFLSGMAQKADKADVKQELQTKVSKDEFEKMMERKAEVADVSEALTLKASFDDVKKLSEQMATHRSHIKALHKSVDAKASIDSVEEVAHIVQALPTTTDIRQIQDGKVSATDFTETVANIEKALKEKASIADLRESIVQQNAINETLCGEQCIARWVWRSGKLRPNGIVPWNVQVANSAPDVYLWEKDKGSIGIVQPGLYEITFGFYGKKKPTIQVLVNDEPILSAVNTASYVIHHSSGRMLSTGTHSAGNITGLTMIDFIALPPKAKISISYAGEDGGEGFLGLKKLC